MKLKIFILFLLTLIFAAGCTTSEPVSEEVVIKGEGQKVVNLSDEYDFSGELEDVSDGLSSGIAYAKYDGQTYELYVEFRDLPELEEGFFYEGWIVRKKPTSVLSTGGLIMKEGKYINIFMNDKDLSDHDFYVLTLEPDDGDPAPDKHILEGTLVNKK